MITKKQTAGGVQVSIFDFIIDEQYQKPIFPITKKTVYNVPKTINKI
ncbi:MAG: hypothetical protein ACYCZ2_18845 [Lutibacter sp.]